MIQEQFILEKDSNLRKLVWTLIGLAYLGTCLYLSEREEERPSPILQTCSRIIHDYSVYFVYLILIPLTIARQIASFKCFQRQPGRFMRFHRLIEIYENVSIGFYVIVGMLDMFKMTFGRGCNGMLSIHTFNYFVIMFCGVRIASLVITIALLIACCFPCFIVLMIGAFFQQRQHRVERENLTRNIFSIKYDKLQKDCEGCVPDISLAECSICLSGFLGSNEKALSVTPLPCDLRHVFHTECIRAWFERESMCPLCKAPITEAMMR